MADDAADKDAKNADESAVTSDAEKAESSAPSSAAVESTAEGTTEAATAEVADFDAEDSEKTKDSGAVEDSDDEDISLEPDEEENPKRIRGRHWALTAAAIVAIAIVALAAIIGRLYEEQRIEEQSSRGPGGGAGIRQRHDQRGQRQARRELQQDLGEVNGRFQAEVLGVQHHVAPGHDREQGQSHWRRCGFCGEVGGTGQGRGVAVHRSGGIQRGNS